jgi:non-heme chloroperoxidase
MRQLKFPSYPTSFKKDFNSPGGLRINYINVGNANSYDIKIYYEDWGSGQPIVFSHGWPISADAFEYQMFFSASHWYRCVVRDRGGHGRSSQPWSGNDRDTYADDLVALAEALD